MMKSIHPTWKQWLAPYISSPSFAALERKLSGEPEDTTLPPSYARFVALSKNPHSIKVVVLGQDPYHGPGQAMGLAFSVPLGVAPPPSLANIYKEIEQEGGAKADGRNGDLTPWNEQGVLLLNTALSVRAGDAGSHYGWGWEDFTDGAIKELAERTQGLAFLLWGKHAQTKAKLIPDGRGHLILQAPHPSPLSSYRGFFGCGHFRLVNEFLRSQGKAEIAW
jgi:uracil-DNA glycosylase